MPPTDQIPRYSILIVGYNSLHFLKNCIYSLLRGKFQDFEILFLDNASPQPEGDFVERNFPDTRVHVYHSPKNLFFSGGNNFLAAKAKGENLILLNPDTEVDPDWLVHLEKFRLERGLEAAQLDLRSLKDRITRETRGVFLDRAGFISHAEDEGEEPQRIFSGRGAALVARRDIYFEAGGLDDDFGMYFEETDLCWRIQLLGYSMYYVPGSIVYHWVGGSSGKSRFFRINAFRFTRNRVWSLCKNFEAGNLARYLPLHYGIYGLQILGDLFRLRLGEAFTQVLGLIAPLSGLSRLWAKRRLVQTARKVSDRQLVDLGLIRRDFKYFL